jgi:hypothetical protein
MATTAASKQVLIKTNISYARRYWAGECSKANLAFLKELTTRFSLSTRLGEVRPLDGTWYITHAGLLRIAERRRCYGIHVQMVVPLSDPACARWVVRATVYKSISSIGFVGYGDADPSNVSPLVRGAEMRIAETRAVNRALRKAYGIGLCSVEELGWSPRPSGADQSNKNTASANGNNGHQNGPPRLRDRLCLLIRQHRLDPGLVKAYAADYCGTRTLRDATREQVEAFISHLTERASNDREALLCHLNSYPRQEEPAK